MEVFGNIYKSYISHDKAQRENAENFINQMLARCDPQDISYLLESLLSIDKSAENNYQIDFTNSVKLFISMILKKIFESCITEQNYNLYLAFISNIRYDIIKIILNLNSDIKTLNFLIVIIENLIVQFREIFNHNEMCAVIFEFYNNSKSNNLTEQTFRSLYIFFKVLKIVSSLNREEESQKNEFLSKLTEDFCSILGSFTEFIVYKQQQEQLQSIAAEQPLQIMVKYINLYFKIFKHSVNFMNKENRVTVMNKTYDFLYFMLFKLNPSLIDKNLFDAIFIANKILLKYTSYVSRVDLKIIKNFSELFYEYIINNQFYSCINSVIRSNYSNYGEFSEKEKKFLTNIIDFFKELLQLNTNDNWGDLLFFKDCFSDDMIKISEYLENEFFTNTRYESIIYFIIRNCMFFTPADIEMFNNDIEEFYIWYDNLNPMFDLREKAGLLARIIYDRNKHNLKSVFGNLEQELLKLCEKENPEYFGIQGSSAVITPDEANLKCGLLYFFECLCFIYYNKHKDYDLWIKKILFSHFDSLRKGKGDIFSKFIVFRIFIKVIDFKEIAQYKEAIFMNIYEVYMLPVKNSIYHHNNQIQFTQNNNNLIDFNSNYGNFVKYSEEIYLLKFAAVDFFFSYFEEIFTPNLAEGFLANFVKETCILFKQVSSPIIHNKLIKTSLNILNIFNEEEIGKSFTEIFPIIKALWVCNFDNSYNSSSTVIKRNMISISVLRKNLFQLISIFVKKIGIFFDNDLNYFQFVYEIIGYALTSRNAESGFIFTEGLKTLLLIQDEFYNINRSKNFDLGYPKNLSEYTAASVNANLNNLNDNNNNNAHLQSVYDFCSYEYFLKLYDFMNILLETLSISDDYFIIILKIIEQFLSLVFIREIRDFIFSDNLNIIGKLMSTIEMLFTKHSNTFHQPIFNFIEFCIYCLNSVNFNSNAQNVNSINNPENVYALKVSEFNNFIFNLINNFQTSFQNSDFNAINLSEKDEILLYMLLGTIQLSNRLIYVNFKNRAFDLLFNKKIIEFISIITNNIELNKKLNLLHKRIIYNLLFNIEKITNLILTYFSQAPNFDSTVACVTLDLVKNLQIKFKEYNSLNYIDKYMHTQNHWLYFFEKVGSNTQFYNLTMEEESLKMFWNGRFENNNYSENDLGEINYEIKYAILVYDTLYKTDSNEPEEENQEETNADAQFFN